ncbi:hypothetical protein N7510_006472 [Penicillium lagena]|uniref:uncharacterized protein n=1 Tax=Penicillium lagena TaxID=94218 RepID=UPI0025417F57|nr:uncharacterized protein N7510_006472 [Penicillium lagena]KAJ5613278.1 hypothetical protein N7510_006472 [Penicillium lagena]
MSALPMSIASPLYPKPKGSLRGSLTRKSLEVLLCGVDQGRPSIRLEDACGHSHGDHCLQVNLSPLICALSSHAVNSLTKKENLRGASQGAGQVLPAQPQCPSETLLYLTNAFTFTPPSPPCLCLLGNGLASHQTSPPSSLCPASATSAKGRTGGKTCAVTAADHHTR